MGQSLGRTSRLFLSRRPFGMKKNMRIGIKGKEDGFTLLEVILVLIFISIFATIAVSRQDNPDVTLKAASEVLKSQIRYAQMRAMNSNVPWGVHYSDTVRAYWLFNGIDANNRQAFPGESEDNVDLDADGITIEQGNFTLRFDQWGVPVIEDAGFAFSAGQAVLRMTSGSESSDITITANTGFVR